MHLVLHSSLLYISSQTFQEYTLMLLICVPILEYLLYAADAGAVKWETMK